MAAPLPTPRYCIQHGRFNKQDGWRLCDVSVQLYENIAVTCYNKNTGQTSIDVYSVRNSDSRDKPKIFYSKQFEKYESEDGRWIYWYRYVSFVDFYGDNRGLVIATGIGDKLELFDLIQDRVLKSRKITVTLINHGGIKCLSVREREIFIGFRESNKITVYDVIDLNEIKSIILQGIQDGYWPYDMTAIADRIFVCVSDGKEGGNHRSLIYEEKNGRILSELTKPTDTVPWYTNSITVSVTLGVVAVTWSQTFEGKQKGIDVIVFYSLFSENNSSFLIVEVKFGISRIRISDRGDRMVTKNRLTHEVKTYDMAEFFTYSHFKEKLVSTLQTNDYTRLANFFNITKDQTDVILGSDTPSENLLIALEEEGVLQPYNVDRLTKALHELKINPICCHLAEFFQKTRGSSSVNEAISDLTQSFKMMDSQIERNLYRQEAALNLAETHWTSHVARDGRIYYYNSVTKQSTWEKGKAESKRWADMISILNEEVDSLKSVGSLKYSKKAKISTGSSGSHIFGGKFENRDVAVKKIINENVQRETQLYGLMKTKFMSNVLKILHIEEDEDFTYVVTELCEYDLKAVIEDPQNPVGHNLTPEKRIKLCVDILRGLKDLHSIDVIHRDLKPSNILIDVDGDAFVADFGISRNLIGETTQVTSCFGTMCWIAQESYQSRNEKVRYKKESDVQVAGCLIYYILSNGHHPFEATSPFLNDTVKLMSNVAEGNFSLLHLARYPAQCTALLKRMLDQDILKRPLIDDCLNEMEAVRQSCTSSFKRNALTIDNRVSSATVLPHNTEYLSESLIADTFAKLVAKVSQEFTRNNCVLLGTYFNFPGAKIAMIKEESNTPGLDLFETMKERNIINMYDVTNLQQALADLNLNEINKKFVTPYLRKIDPRIHERHKILPKEH